MNAIPLTHLVTLGDQHQGNIDYYSSLCKCGARLVGFVESAFTHANVAAVSERKNHFKSICQRRGWDSPHIRRFWVLVWWSMKEKKTDLAGVEGGGHQSVERWLHSTERNKCNKLLDWRHLKLRAAFYMIHRANLGTTDPLWINRPSAPQRMPDEGTVNLFGEREREKKWDMKWSFRQCE